jgi:chitodextrinase
MRRNMRVTIKDITREMRMTTVSFQVKQATARLLTVATVTVFTAATAIIAMPSRASAAACAAGTKGTVSAIVTVPATATYRVWSRIMAPDSTNNNYYLEIDGNQCFLVGNSAISANTWTWVDYRDGNTGSKINVSLNQGSHTIKMIGSEDNVKLDRVIFASDASCVPTGNGSNCETTTDTVPPTVKLTAPTANSTVSGTVNVSADVTDNIGVKKADFYVDSALKSSDTSSPYGFSWNTTEVPNGSHLLTVKASDAAGNMSSDSYKVNVQNGDKQAPTVPTEVKATATAYNKVDVSWKASTDNVSVKGYTVFRDDVPVAALVTGTTYQDTGLTADTEYAYKVVAIDSAGNKSQSSSVAIVRTPQVAADKEAPSVPSDVTAEAVSARQINLTWEPSTDNVAVKSYDVYRASDNGDFRRVANIRSTSFGDMGLDPNTTYRYYVKARDASNNVSEASVTVSAKTQERKRRAVLYGTVQAKRTGRPIPQATVVLTVHDSKQIYTTNGNGRYVFRGLETGRYSATYRAEGYSSKTISIKVNDQVVHKNVTLEKR